MKQLIFAILFLITAYCVYADISSGTLPKEVPAKEAAETGQTFTTIKISSGDTLISIIDEADVSVPVDIIIQDFMELNEGISPYELQIGKSYKFPLYNE